MGPPGVPRGPMGHWSLDETPQAPLGLAPLEEDEAPVPLWPIGPRPLGPTSPPAGG